MSYHIIAYSTGTYIGIPPPRPGRRAVLGGGAPAILLARVLESAHLAGW